MQPHEDGERCRGTATPVMEAGASEQGGAPPPPPLPPPRGVAQRCWAAWAAILDPTCTTIEPILAFPREFADVFTFSRFHAKDIE